MSVTVGELIEGLKQLDPDLLVVIPLDLRENTFRPMDEPMTIGTFYDDGPKHGEFYGSQASEDDYSEDEGGGYDDDDDTESDIDVDVDAQSAVVLWPES